MNINANELLLLKKIKFAGADNDAAKETGLANNFPQETEQPQTDLNSLMFKGLNNLMSNPHLAKEVGVMNEIAPKQGEDNDAKEYVAPFKSNLAFQGKASKIKSIALAAMIGLGGGSLTTSCIENPRYQIQSVEIDMSMISEMLAEMKEMRKDMANRDAEYLKRLDKVIEMFSEVMKLMDQQIRDNKDFQELVIAFKAQLLANQEIIIELMIDQGYAQDEAQKKFDGYLKDLQDGTKSIQEILTEIKNLTSDIKGLLQQAIKDLQEYADRASIERQELIETNRNGFDELIQQGKLSFETLQRMEAKNDSLIVLSNKQIEAQESVKESVKEAIKKANLDSNANFETVVKTLNVNKNELINVIMRLGYTQAQIQKMTAAEIIKAIDNNTEVTKGTNKMLSFISKQLRILPDLLKENKITNAQLKEIKGQAEALMAEAESGKITAEQFYQKAVTYMIGSSVNQKIIIHQLVKNGKTEAEANELLKNLKEDVESGNKKAEADFNEIINLLGEINETLTDMNQTLKGMSENFNKFYQDYNKNKKTELRMFGELVKENKFQSHVLVNMSNTQEEMSKNLKGIKANTDSLLVIAQDETKHNELINTIKDVQNGKNTEIDYNRFEQMFKLLNMNLSDVIRMSSYDLQQAIRNFQNTYIKTEEKQLDALKNIQLELAGLKAFIKEDNKGIIDAINGVTEAVNNGSEDVTEELQVIQAQLDKLQATVNAMLKAIGEQAARVNASLGQFNLKFNAALGLLVNIDTKMSSISTNVKLATRYLASIDNEVKNLKEEIVKLQNMAGGSNISMEELEEMWSRHDAENYEKYSKLIKELGLNQGGTVDFTTIEGLLASIDEKMDNIKDNSDILNQILDKLKGFDFNSPDNSDKLDRIIEILENFKCNCECGGNNEGILGDLDKILG